jgi:hypothetical protein
MPATTKPVAKSLHTVTVLVQVATIFMKADVVNPEDALGMASKALGLDGREDPYNTHAAALKQLAS